MSIKIYQLYQIKTDFKIKLKKKKNPYPPTEFKMFPKDLFFLIYSPPHPQIRYQQNFTTFKFLPHLPTINPNIFFLSISIEDSFAKE